MEHPTYETTDIYISSVLATIGYKVEVKGTEYSQTQQVFYIELEEPAQLQEIQATVNLYWQGGLTVDPNALFSNYKALRGKVLKNKN